MEAKHQTSWDYRNKKRCPDFHDEEYWNKILQRRNDPIPAHVQARLDEYNKQAKAQESEEDDDFDVTEAYIELRAQAEKAEEAEDREISLEQMIQESVDYYRTIPMYDFGSGRMSNEQAMMDFYGSGMVHRIREEIEQGTNYPNDVWQTGHVSQRLWQELKDIRAGRKPRPERTKRSGTHRKGSSTEQKAPAKAVVATPKPEHSQPKEVEVTQRERQRGDDYFLTLERGIVRNESYRELFKGPGTVYEWIWANVVRSQWQDTKGYPIKEKYYDNGYLAYCSSYRQLARDCGLHKNKVKEYVDNFKKAGVIKVEHLVPTGKKRGQSVFIIGRWHPGKDENGKKKVFEHYFRDGIFITKKDGQNVSN